MCCVTGPNCSFSVLSSPRAAPTLAMEFERCNAAFFLLCCHTISTMAALSQTLLLLSDSDDDHMPVEGGIETPAIELDVIQLGLAAIMMPGMLFSTACRTCAWHCCRRS